MSVPETTRPRPRHRPGLDGVRGIAVAAVIAYHLGHLRGGFLGVDVFFVLSGYLITSLILAEAAGTGGLSLRAFWGRRIRRLVPALVVMVVGVVGAALALGWPPDERESLALDATATLTWWANWRQAGGASYWDSGESLFRHAWSLSIEEQFYLVWPLVVTVVLTVVLGRRLHGADGGPVPADRARLLAPAIGAVAAVGAVASSVWMVVLSSRLADADLSRAYVGTDTRVAAPLAGCALAALLAGRVDRWAAHPVGGRLLQAGGLVGAVVLAAMAVTVSVEDPALYRDGGFALAAVAACLVVAAVASVDRDVAPGRDPLGWATTRRATGYLGTRSYALYLWSWPLQVLLVFRFAEIGDAALAVLVVAGSLALAEASYRWVEHPLRHRDGWATSPRLRRPAWALGLVAAVAVVGVCAATAEPPPVHETIETDESAADALRPADTTTAPAPGDQADAGLDVLLLGDSVAWTVGYYGPPADDLPPGIASIDTRAIIGCGLLSDRGWEYRRGSLDGPFELPNEACRDLGTAARIGLEAGPDVVVTMPGAWEWSDMRLPDGTVLEARSDRLAEVLRDDLVEQIGDAHAVGARFVAVEWSCPGSEAADVRGDDDYIRWINQVMADAVAEGRRVHGADAEVLPPNDEVCVGGDPTAEPTPAKAQATGDEVHVSDEAGGRWMWDTWLGPGLT
ncbi:MAG: acyltransferase [Acidimicrobiales bacterium]|nr:acyltransferase [Acidimicrobiales bacterium]